MSSHGCQYQISRLRCHYKGIDYQINECEECGALGLFAGQESEKRQLNKDAAEFDEVIEMIDFLIRSIRR